MRIIQLTDPHLPPEGGSTQLGIDCRRNFLDMLPRAAALRPDLIVLSGDLCYDLPDAATFQWVRAEMDALDLPYSVIAGNHDDSVLLGMAFDLPVVEKEVYFLRHVGLQPVLFLDTALATISNTQLAWLEERMADLEGPILLFMHHPPMLTGMPFMDENWPFRRSGEVMTILHRYPSPVYVFCGHNHTERVIHAGNVSVHITPSTYYQLDPETAQPTVEHTRMGLRKIDFRENRLYTAVQYFNGHNS